MTVHGTTTTVESTVVTIKDPIFTLGDDAIVDAKDRGIEFKYDTGTGAKDGFFGWQVADGRFHFIPDATNNSEVFTGIDGDLQIGNLYLKVGSNGITDLTNGTLQNVSDRWNLVYKNFVTNLSSATDGQLIRFNGTSGLWENSDLIDGGTYN